MSITSDEAAGETGRAWRGRQVFEKLGKSPAMRLPRPGKPAIKVHVDRVRAVPAVTPTVSGSLGLFSIGLGLAELLAPSTIKRELGLKHVPTAAVRTLYGLRELTVGWGLVSDPTESRWLWARVAGDVLDIATLGSATTGDPTARKRTGNMLAMLTAITVVDVLCARALTLERAGPLSLTGRLQGRGKRG